MCMIKSNYCFQPVAQISLPNLNYNLSVIKDLCGKSDFVSVVKTNAYGHGMRIATYADKFASAFAVSRLEELISLRYLGITKPIFMLVPTSLNGLRQLALYDGVALVFSLDYLRQLSTMTFTNKLFINLKVDCGMKRLGFNNLEQFETALKILKVNKSLSVCGVYSHFSCPKNQKNTAEEYKTFMQYVALFDNYFDGMRHVSSSGGLLLQKYNLDAVRVGIMQYGYLPFKANFTLKPVMKIVANPISARNFYQCETALYNSVATSGSHSLVNYGYADGLPRKNSPNLCMDLGYFPSKGKQVVIMDNAQTVADKNNTICYEVLVHSANRIKKVYIN